MDKDTLPVTVPEVGEFVFRLRTMRLEFRIQAEIARLCEGVTTPTAWLETLAEMTATIKVLAVQQPPDFDVDGMDPLEPDSYRQLSSVYAALRGAENRFRGRHADAGQATGTADGGHGGAVVPADLPAGAH